MIYQKIKISTPVYRKLSIFPRAIRYDIDIEQIFRYFRYIEASLTVTQNFGPGPDVAAANRLAASSEPVMSGSDTRIRVLKAKVSPTNGQNCVYWLII